MPVTQTFTTTIKGSLGTLNPAPDIISGDEVVAVSDVVAPNSTLVEAAVVDKDKLVAMYLWSDKDITVTTNAGADDTFNLTANVPYWWNSNSPGANPVTVDITELHFVNNPDADPANVKAEFLLAVTP
jgi:hypothetical protein